jgi:GntR family transcriptional repressor for pyruvate dehydrogenase complex
MVYSVELSDSLTAFEEAKVEAVADCLFMPVETARTSERAAEQFLEMIRSQKLKCGDKLPPEQTLAQALGISRATVREALSGLKALGLIVSRSGKGNFIAEDDSVMRDWDRLLAEIRDRSAFLEAIEARRALESEVCSLAAERATQNQLAAIRAALDLGQGATSPTDFRPADYQFHLSLALASGNRLFIRFTEECFLNLSGHYWDILRQAGTDGSVFAVFHGEHGRVFEAIAARSPAKAREKMIAHIETIRADFLRAAGLGGQRR